MRFLIVFCLFWTALEGKPPVLDQPIVQAKMKEMMQAHASVKELSPVVVKRMLGNFLDELDPSKTYFIEGDIHQWLEPDDITVNQAYLELKNGQSGTFEKMYGAMIAAVQRRDKLEKKIDNQHLPHRVDVKKFKDLQWAKNEEELLQRLTDVRALQVEASMKLNAELQEKSLQRIDKRRNKFEEELTVQDPKLREQQILSKELKAFAGALDSHTAYFTPEEAQQFLINVQQRLFGVGAQLRDDISGFTVTKIVEGGPAASSDLKENDRIIAVNGEPVVGMDIVDAVGLIRGDKDTPLDLTVVREVEGKEETKNVHLKRGEVVLKETRYEASYEPFGEGVIAYLRLFSFYQDPESSSAQDLANALKKMQAEHKVLGVILDLRSNSGGMLSQAVNVTGLFITKGVVVSIKDDKGDVQHLRDTDGLTVWNGPLVVMINRVSASASEIVAQALKDYGRALIVGDDHSFGKGSFQTFTLNANDPSDVNPQGEFKVTRGRYYTVSGKTPQLVGVTSDVTIPGSFSQSEIGEKFAKYPLEEDQIRSHFDDDLSDLPLMQRTRIALLYKNNLQKKEDIYSPYIQKLNNNVQYRIEHNKDYQAFLKEVKNQDFDWDEEKPSEFGKNDLQLTEAMNVMKDLVVLLQNKKAA